MRARLDIAIVGAGLACAALLARDGHRVVVHERFESSRPFFQPDSTTLALARDLTFHRMKLLPYLRREMLHTLAGLKTGLFTHRAPKMLAGDPGNPGSPGESVRLF